MPFEKNFYIEHPNVTKRSSEEADAWRASKQIVVHGDDIPKPVMTFEEASMPEYILSEVLKCGFEKPTPIQSQGWPMALKGRNMVGVSRVNRFMSCAHIQTYHVLPLGQCHRVGKNPCFSPSSYDSYQCSGK